MATKEDSFVGLTFNKGIPKISFPMGFTISKDEVNLRKDICLLLSCLQNNNCAKIKDETADVNNCLQSVEEFPFLSYKYLIDDYVRNGIWITKEKEYKSDSRGKINWKKTIKTITPYIQDNFFIYNNFIVQRNKVNESELLTNIHKFCIYLSFEKIGWLYNDMKFKKPNIIVNVKQFLSVLNKVNREIFIDEKRKLIGNMISILKGLDESQDKSLYKVGTNRFEYLWEYMLDKKFGIVNKQEYFPRASWELINGTSSLAPLELDTIFFKGNDAFIVDAKYYKYGITNNNKDLPATSTIAKQIIYGQFVGKKTNKNVLNAFILPYSDGKIEYLGNANVDWLSESEKKYNNIKMFAYDTKKLMLNYMAIRNDEIEELQKKMKDEY